VKRRMAPKIPWRAMTWDTLFMYSAKFGDSGAVATGTHTTGSGPAAKSSSLVGHLYYYFNHLNFINLIIFIKYQRYGVRSEGKNYESGMSNNPIP
jgi:hypothetical protein